MRLQVHREQAEVQKIGNVRSKQKEREEKGMGRPENTQKIVITSTEYVRGKYNAVSVETAGGTCVLSYYMSKSVVSVVRYIM